MAGGHLGEFEQLLLLAVLHLEPRAHGAAIRRTLKERGRRSASLGAIYSTVRRLTAKGLVEVEEVPSPRGGRPRRHVRATQAAVEALRESRASWNRMTEGLEDRLGTESV